MGDDPNRGLYAKFKVERMDGTSAPGQKHENCQAFVIDIQHDEFAPWVLMYYAGICEMKYPVLALDLKAKAKAILKIKWAEEER